MGDRAARQSTQHAYHNVKLAVSQNRYFLQQQRQWGQDELPEYIVTKATTLWSESVNTHPFKMPFFTRNNRNRGLTTIIITQLFVLSNLVDFIKVIVKCDLRLHTRGSDL